MKIATKVFLEVKKLLKLRFLDYFLKVETRECDQEDWSVSYKFGNITPCSATCYLEVSAPVSLKGATKKIGVPVKKFEIITLCSATYPQEVRALVLLKVATKACLGGKKTLKI